jgi:hypothetical protein
MRQWGGAIMERIARLREEANVIRDLSRSFDTPKFRDQLLSIAELCERLADSAERSSPEEMRKTKRTHPMFNW